MLTECILERIETFWYLSSR